MKKSFVVLIVLIIMICVAGCTNPEEKAMKVANGFFEEMYDAKPKTIEIIKFSHENFEKHIKDKYDDTISTKFMKKQFLGDRLVFIAPQIAETQNADISLFEINLKRVNEKEEDYYFNFEGKVKINYLDEKEDVFPFIKGQIRITQEDGKYKVHGIRYFNDETIKFRYH
jgi:hypothetical protein